MITHYMNADSPEVYTWLNKVNCQLNTYREAHNKNSQELSIEEMVIILQSLKELKFQVIANATLMEILKATLKNM